MNQTTILHEHTYHVELIDRISLCIRRAPMGADLDTSDYLVSMDPVLWGPSRLAMKFRDAVSVFSTLHRIFSGGKEPPHSSATWQDLIHQHDDMSLSAIHTWLQSLSYHEEATTYLDTIVPDPDLFHRWFAHFTAAHDNNIHMSATVASQMLEEELIRRRAVSVGLEGDGE